MAAGAGNCAGSLHRYDVGRRDRLAPRQAAFRPDLRPFAWNDCKFRSGVRMVKSGDATRSRPRRALRCLANGEESQGLQDDLAMPLFVYVSTSKGQPGVGTVLRNLQPCPESNPSLPGDRGNQPGESGGPNCLSQSTGAVSLRKRKPGFWPGESKTFRNVMKREHLRSA
jgi:hypothetical protein